MLTCRLCKNKECLACTTFDGACSSCISNAALTNGSCACLTNAFWLQSSQTCEFCDNLCGTCAGVYYFECSICTTGKTKVDSICLHDCPYGFASSCTSVNTQIINQAFTGDFAGSYGIFTTATSASFFQFFNSPETTDPIPMKNRGLYFSSGKYLESNVNVYLNYKFTIGFWGYVESSGDMFEKQTRIQLHSNGVLTVKLEKPNETTQTVATSPVSSTGWTYYSFTVSYSPGSTSITVYLNNFPGISVSTDNHIFRDIISQTLIIGKSTSLSSFSGFIYKFTLYNTAVTDFSSLYNDDICGTGLTSTCL